MLPQCVCLTGATEWLKFFILVLMLCYNVSFYVVLLSEVIRAEAETSLLNHENKYLDVTFVFDEYQLFFTKVRNIQTTIRKSTNIFFINGHMLGVTQVP